MTIQHPAPIPDPTPALALVYELERLMLGLSSNRLGVFATLEGARTAALSAAQEQARNSSELSVPASLEDLDPWYADEPESSPRYSCEYRLGEEEEDAFTYVIQAVEVQP